jgi:hypothetical protein
MQLVPYSTAGNTPSAEMEEAVGQAIEDAEAAVGLCVALHDAHWSALCV